MNPNRFFIRIILAVSLAATTLPMMPARLALAANTCTVTVPADTGVTMGDSSQGIPFTVTNTGNDLSIDTVELEFDANVYDIGLSLVPPDNWQIDAIKQAGQGQTWVRYKSNDAVYNIAPGATQTFYVTLIGVSNSLFSSDPTDQIDTLDSRTFVRKGNTNFSCTWPTWPRKGLAVAVTAVPLSLPTGQALVVNAMITNRSSVSQANITGTLTYTGTGGITLVTGPAPGSLTLASGASASMVYTYTASADGAIVFTDRAGNASVTPQPAQSEVVYIGSWTAAAEINTLRVVSGQQVIVQMAVQNNTRPSIGNVVPTLTPTGTATMTLVSGPTPNKINSIPPGSSGTFEWTYRITGPTGATFAFSGYATDKDGRATNTSTSATGRVSKYSVSASPAQVPADSRNFSVAFTVYNNGGTPLDKVIFGFSPGWIPSESGSSGGYNGDWNKSSNNGTNKNTFTFSAGNVLPAGQSATFSIYFTYGPNPASDTSYDFITALYYGNNINSLQGGAEPSVLVTKFKVVLAANPASGIPAEGASTSTITAIVTQGGTPQADVTVQFQTTAGILSSGTAATDASGRAVVRLTAPISTQAITATVTGRYLTAYDTENVAFVGYTGPNPLYVGGTLNPMGGNPGDTVTIVLDAINLGTQPVTLTTASTVSFTDGTHGYTATLAAPVFIVAGARSQLTFVPAALDPNFTRGVYYPTLNSTGWITSSLVTRTYIRPVTDPFSVGIAALRASLSASPGLVNIGQLITVTMVVTNVGLSTANVITSSVLTLGGTGNAILVSGPSPASTLVLAAGSITTFTWTCTAANPGTLNWTGRAYGTDADAGLPIVSSLSTSNNVTAVLPAALSATFAVPAMASQGQTITVTLRVTDTGQATANSVTPGPLTIGGTGSAAYTSGPTPGIVAAVFGGSSTAFAWTYTAGNLGTVNWSGVVTGTDANSGRIVTATAASNNVIIQTPTALACALAAAPGSVGTGGIVLITMTVTNTGQATALTVNPSALTIGGTGGVGLVSGPSGALTTINGGASTRFTWSYQAAAAGTINWTGNAAGTDGNSGANVAAANCASNNVTVASAAFLVSSITAAPEAVGQSETVTVTMIVTNSGTNAANNVTPAALTLSAAALFPTLVSGPTPASTHIAAGSAAAFVWVYRSASNQTGRNTWTGNATGTDAVTGNPIGSLSTASNSAAVYAVVPDKTAQAPRLVGNVGPGEVVTYTIVVRNTGGGQANLQQVTDALPSGFVYNGDVSVLPAGCTFASKPSSGQTGTIIWLYNGACHLASGANATLVFTTTASGASGTFCNGVGLTVQGAVDAVTRSNLACVTVGWPEYLITAQAGSQTIRVRVRLAASGQPVILLWEFLP
jgi:uncharacterized repeat protein (TIGR01451 family)